MSVIAISFRSRLTSGSCLPLQFISVVLKQTLPHQAETQERHQVSVESCVVLREGRTHR